MQIFLYLCSVFWQMEPILGHISKNQVRFIRSLQQKKVRDEQHLFVAEGDKCIGELLGHFDLVTLVVTGASGISGISGNPTPLLPYSSTPLPLYSSTSQELSQMSSLKTPQGSLAVFRQKDPNPSFPSKGKEVDHSPLRGDGGVCLALDGVQDPGNLGTIIRTADWFGITDIYCSLDTADCYNPKVVQATMGALARVSVHYIDLVNWLSSISGISGISGTSSPLRGGLVGSLPIYGTLLDGRNLYEKDAIPDPARGIIVMGNEGNGISAEVKKFITHPLYIPSYTSCPIREGLEGSHIESLNVAIATAITLAEFRRLSQQK